MIVECSHCGEQNEISDPDDDSPITVLCQSCGESFTIEQGE